MCWAHQLQGLCAQDSASPAPAVHQNKAKGKKIKEVDPDSLAARTGGGGLGLDWDKIKFGGGKTGAQNRDQRS